MTDGPLCHICIGSVVGVPTHCYGSEDVAPDHRGRGGFMCSCYCRGLVQDVPEDYLAPAPSESPSAPPSLSELLLERGLADELAQALRDAVMTLDQIATSAVGEHAQAAAQACVDATPAFARYQQVRTGLAESEPTTLDYGDPKVVFHLATSGNGESIPNDPSDIQDELLRINRLAEGLLAGVDGIVDDAERVALAELARRTAELLALFSDTLRLIRPTHR